MDTQIRIRPYDDEISVLHDNELNDNTGTKSVLVPHIFSGPEEIVYASPLQGGFQVALAYGGKVYGKKVTIFTLRHSRPHPNVQRCMALGATVIQGRSTFLRQVEREAREYCKPSAKLITFGANHEEYVDILQARAAEVLREYEALKGGLPNEIWVSVGSGTLIKSIQRAAPSIKINGVQVGRPFEKDPAWTNMTILPYPKEFSWESKYKMPFPSNPNYDRKAFELCVKHHKGNVLFWNVM